MNEVSPFIIRKKIEGQGRFTYLFYRSVFFLKGKLSLFPDKICKKISGLRIESAKKCATPMIGFLMSVQGRTGIRKGFCHDRNYPGRKRVTKEY